VSRALLSVILVTSALLLGGCASTDKSSPKGGFQAWIDADAAKNTRLSPLKQNGFEKSDSKEKSGISANYADRAKWAMFGEYLSAVIARIQKKWDRLLADSRTFPPSGTVVEVVFLLNAEGGVESFSEVRSTSSKQGKDACLSAVAFGGPYGKWSPQMVARLGRVQELTFTFYYQ
jgi:hypothetical protein